ncbi:MAG: Electron transfer flavoprotein alpha/beta-subunit [Firmicutes bacterium]|nr:Electron transfer flavoprotein alpha/beta-subunit [Bacillota bacterium]
MNKILVCYKWVLDEKDIKINPEDLTVNTSRAKYKISDYDKNAIEAGVLLSEAGDVTVDAVTFGVNTKQSVKDALSRGLNKVYYIADVTAEAADSFVSSNVLASAVNKIGSYDIIICGEGSSDTYNQQVAPRLATILGIPTITFVKEFTVDGNRVIATRKLGDCTEVVTVTGPVVISVLPEINKPRIPSLKQVMAAAKKPSEELKLTDLAINPECIKPKAQNLSTKGYVMNRKNIIYKEANQAVNVAKLVESIAQNGVC